MGEIKSAAEIAREKLEKIGDITEDERLQWKYVPEGEKLAARYIKENRNISAELNKYEEKALRYVAAGATAVLIRNITLPRNDAARKNNTKAMEGLKAIKKDKVALENAFSKLRHILNHYTEQGAKQKQQAYESLKAEFEQKVQRALQQQTGVNAKLSIDITQQPQFQEEWRRVEAQFDDQYLAHLNGCKQELAAID